MIIKNLIIQYINKISQIHI